MEKIIFFSLVVTIIFLVLKVVEMKYIEKEWAPVKNFIRDICMVFASSFLGGTILLNAGNSVTQMFNILTDTKVSPTKNANVFTDNPNF
jgi:hypothetical protein